MGNTRVSPAAMWLALTLVSQGSAEFGTAEGMQKGLEQVTVGRRVLLGEGCCHSIRKLYRADRHFNSCYKRFLNELEQHDFEGGCDPAAMQEKCAFCNDFKLEENMEHNGSLHLQTLTPDMATGAVLLKLCML